MHLNPTQVAIRIFGTPAALSSAIGVRSSAPFRWLAPRATRGDPGDIPVPQIRRIIEAARARGLAIDERDLLYGRDIVEVPEPAEPALSQ